MMDATPALPQYDHTILIVDDDPPSLGVVYRYLEEHGFEIMVATDGELGLQRAEYGQPDIILLDILMPGMDGYEICRCLKENRATKDIPVIFLTALGSTADKVKGFALGGVDYITKPLDNEEVLARVLTQLKIRDLTRELERTCKEQERHIQERTIELARANEELKAEIAERKHKEALINLRLELINYADNHTLDELFYKALDEVEQLTQSRISFYHRIDDDQKSVQLQAWSTRTMEQFCTARGKGMHYPLDKAGVWVDCVYERRPVIHNDYDSLENKKGLPEGHAPLKRELVVPIFRENKIVAILGVGNKSNDYTETDTTIASYCADVVWEISERKRAEAELKESEESYRNLFEYASIPLFEQDFSAVKQEVEKLKQEDVKNFHAFFKEHPEIVTKCLQLVKLTDVNKAGLQMYEANCKADLEKGLQQLIPPDAYNFFIESLIWITEGKRTHEWECINTTVSGRRITINIGCSVVPGFEDTYSKVLVFVKDITENKKLAEMREKNQQHLEALVKARTAELAAAKEQAEIANATKSDFLARMSHEIRTPLNAVTGITSIILKSNLTIEQRDYLNKIQIASDNLLEVISDILDFSKIEADHLELTQAPFDLDNVVEKLADLFGERVREKDLELIFIIATDVPRQLIGDAPRLIQILTNLIENAVKFTEAGEIVVKVKARDDDKGMVGNRLELNFEVADTGIGISEDLLPSLYDPFSQVEGYLTRKHEGSGLGLAICRRLVELMGGTIKAESTPGKGSTFSFTVMLSTQKIERPRLSLSEEIYGLKTLVVDDSELSRQMLVGLLESFRFDVVAVNSGEKAIAALEKESYQLVLLDWKMPGMDGIETAKRIRRLEHLDPETGNRESQTPIIILVTAYGREIIRKHIDTSIVNRMLLKPIKASGLLNTIMELFGQPSDVSISPDHKPIDGLIQGLSGKRVLLVEDSTLNRDVAIVLLKDVGLSVEVAENGKAAVEMVAQFPQNYYDAVLMDIQMPVMDGYESSKKIREIERERNVTTGQPGTNMPIIALTAHALKGEKEKCLDAGMDDYLSKPIDEQKLYRVLLNWISSQPDIAHPPNPVRGQQVSDISDVLDLESALRLMGGRKKILIKTLKGFEGEYFKAVDTIRHKLNTGEMDAAALIAHSIKSSAALIGSAGLNQAAAMLEIAIREKGSNINSLLSVLKNELESTLEAITEVLISEKEYTDPLSPLDSEIELTPEQIATLPENLLNQLHNTAIKLEIDSSLLIIDKIAEHDAAVGKALRRIVEDLHFDRLLILLEQKLKNSKKST